MGVEYELKFRATEAVQAQIRKDFAGQEQIFQMHTTYYDTPSQSLSRRKYTLRRRMENDLSVCTLKAPAGGAARGEWEVRCQDIYTAIPLLCALGAPADLPALTAEGVVPVCGARFTRIAITMEQDGCILEMALDQGILTGGGKEIPLCEVEVELKSGTPADANRFAALLAGCYNLQPEAHSKFRRALALQQGE